MVYNVKGVIYNGQLSVFRARYDIVCSLRHGSRSRDIFAGSPAGGGPPEITMIGVKLERYEIVEEVGELFLSAYIQ